jgi:hypothetical protein
LLDSFNPWDLIKAVGRAARWLFVGRRSRTLDPSYQGQPGTSFALKPASSTPSTAVTSQPYKGTGGFGHESREDEGDKLLAHAQPAPMADAPQPSGGIDTATPAYRDNDDDGRSYDDRISPVESSDHHRSHPPYPLETEQHDPPKHSSSSGPPSL